MKDRTLHSIVVASVCVAAGALFVVQDRRAAAAEAARSKAVSEALSEQRSWANQRRILEASRSLARIEAEAADRDHERWRTYESEKARRAAWSAYIEADNALREHERKKIPPPTYSE